tara:strand:- start:294 stop:611 length:318 start_codon:yes stop_codon:yes gene_type:complete
MVVLVGMAQPFLPTERILLHLGLLLLEVGVVVELMAPTGEQPQLRPMVVLVEVRVVRGLLVLVLQTKVMLVAVLLPKMLVEVEVLVVLVTQELVTLLRQTLVEMD